MNYRALPEYRRALKSVTRMRRAKSPATHEKNQKQCVAAIKDLIAAGARGGKLIAGNLHEPEPVRLYHEAMAIEGWPEREAFLATLAPGMRDFVAYLLVKGVAAEILRTASNIEERRAALAAAPDWLRDDIADWLKNIWYRDGLGERARAPVTDDAAVEEAAVEGAAG